MKSAAIGITLALLSTAASAQTYVPNPGTCFGNRCGYLGSDGSAINPNPNGGFTVVRPPPDVPWPQINIPRINPYANRGYNRGYNQDDSDEDND